MYTLILIIHLISAIALIGIVLLQAGKGGGLSGAFGSGMGSETLFGSRTGDVLTRATAVTATLFLVSALGLAYLSTKEGSSVAKDIRKSQQQETQQQQQLQVLQELLKQKEAEKAAEKETKEPSTPPKTDVKPPETKKPQTKAPETKEQPPLLPAEAVE